MNHNFGNAKQKRDFKWMRQAYILGRAESGDPSTQNGAILVDPETNQRIADGTNDFPYYVNYTEKRWERPLKYSYVEHAERNCIYDAAKRGVSTKGKHLYCYWAACADCARAIIQSGIERLIVHRPIMEISHERWKDTIDIAFGMLKEAYVKIDYVDEPINDIEILFNGKLWTPNYET